MWSRNFWSLLVVFKYRILYIKMVLEERTVFQETQTFFFKKQKLSTGYLAKQNWKMGGRQDSFKTADLTIYSAAGQGEREGNRKKGRREGEREGRGKDRERKK